MKLLRDAVTGNLAGLSDVQRRGTLVNAMVCLKTPCSDEFLESEDEKIHTILDWKSEYLEEQMADPKYPDWHKAEMQRDWIAQNAARQSNAVLLVRAGSLKFLGGKRAPAAPAGTSVMRGGFPPGLPAPLPPFVCSLCGRATGKALLRGACWTRCAA